MPAYAAQQGWDVLCRHAHGPIILKYGEPYPHKKRCCPMPSRSIPSRAPAKRWQHFSSAAAMWPPRN